jgi:hypothetical protein
MDINYWVIASQAFINELYGKTQTVKVSNFFAPQPASVEAVQFPLINYLTERTIRAVQLAPEWYENLNAKVVAGQRLFQLYSFDTEYSLDTEVREDLNTLEDAYPNDVMVAGCWDVITGDPVGGVGSPWFVTPPELIQFMPDVLIDFDTPAPATELADINLLAGQAPRKFV